MPTNYLKGRNMLQNLRSMFEKKSPPAPDPSKCLVDIKLAGRTHSFFMDSGFADALQMALTSPPTSGFFECKYGRNGYAINLNIVDVVKFFEDAIELDGGDVDGCSIWLSGKEKSIRLGPVETFDSVSAKLAEEQEFIQIGQQHWFHKNQIALIVVQEKKEL
jgi:hypothetical protein